MVQLNGTLPPKRQGKLGIIDIYGLAACCPYNVTEDADLGIRLHRLGYRAAVLPSTTYEEAPALFVSWLKQRTRWYKGWMQTWLVHMRRPVRLLHELSPAGAVAFQLFLACNVFAALIHPLFMAALCYYLIARPPLVAIAAMGHEAPVFFVTLLAGYASTVALDLVGLQRRGLLAHGWVLLHATILVSAFTRSMARTLSAVVCPATLGEDRTWIGEELAARQGGRQSQDQGRKTREKAGKTPRTVRLAAGPAAIMLRPPRHL